MDEVLNLISARSRGEVSNDEVEEAVAKIISSSCYIPHIDSNRTDTTKMEKKRSSTGIKHEPKNHQGCYGNMSMSLQQQQQQRQQSLQADEEDYDDLPVTTTPTTTTLNRKDFDSSNASNNYDTERKPEEEFKTRQDQLQLQILEKGQQLAQKQQITKQIEKKFSSTTIESATPSSITVEREKEEMQVIGGELENLKNQLSEVEFQHKKQQQQQQQQQQNPEQQQMRRTNKTSSSCLDLDDGTGYHPLDRIPLGRQGSKMMRAFGDGKNPNPEAVNAALLATRKWLQVVIQDARALRRQIKEKYNQAREMISSYHPVNKDNNSQELKQNQQQYHQNLQDIDPSILYRASIDGYDHRLSYDPKCGFDVEQLKQLFPEEMMAYSRWNEMHDDAFKEEIANEAADDNSSNNLAIEGDESLAVGHLNERAEQFDIRTARMNKSGYMEFFQIRKKGSFLPRNLRGDRVLNEEQEEDHDNGNDETKNADDDQQNLDAKDDDDCNNIATMDNGNNHIDEDDKTNSNDLKKRKRGRLLKKTASKKQKKIVKRTIMQKPRGRPKPGVWSSRSISQIKFLHWLGFDPSSNLPPPNQETAEAIAFLGYDFMGQIVEKAIYLRNLEKQKREKGSKGGEDNILNKGDSDSKTSNTGEKEDSEAQILLELPDDEQLDIHDIQRAIENNPDIQKSAFFSATDDTDKNSDQSTSKSLLPSASLYFGPGYEDRLEMELELLSGAINKKDFISPMELQIRKEEDELFSKLSAPPAVVDDISQIFPKQKESEPEIKK